MADNKCIDKANLSENEIAEIWIEEAQKRLDAYHAGKMKTFSMDEVFEQNYSITS